MKTESAAKIPNWRLRRRYLAPNVSESFSYIDTVQFIQNGLLDDELFQRIKAANDGRIRKDPIARPKPLEGFFNRFSLHQPTFKVLEMLAEGEVPLYAVHIALDLKIDKRERREAQLFFEQRLLRSLHPATVIRYKGRTAYIGHLASRFGPEIAVYSDLPSKIDGSSCVHIEMRLIKSTALKKHFLRTAHRLLDLDHQHFWRTVLILCEAPNQFVLEKAQRTLQKKRGRMQEDEVIRARTQKFLERIRGRHYVAAASDVLHALQRNELAVGANPARLFRKIDHRWMLPQSPDNAMWNKTSSADVLSARICCPVCGAIDSYPLPLTCGMTCVHCDGSLVENRPWEWP